MKFGVMEDEGVMKKSDIGEFRETCFSPQSQSGRKIEWRLSTSGQRACRHSVYRGPDPTPAVDWRPG